MTIELLVVADCPNTRSAAELLRSVLDTMGLDTVSFTTRVIADQAEAESIGFTGSPSFLVDGRDLFAEPGPAPGLACRVYRTPDGLAGTPAADQLRQALTGAL